MITYRFNYITPTGEVKDFWTEAPSIEDARLILYEMCNDVKKIIYSMGIV